MLGGAALALLAGLATARRAMAPIAELTEAARRDRAHARPVPARSPSPRPTTRSPSSPRRSRTCCARSTPRAAETEAALTRQREFVADASHELRTPLTGVLANLELLEEELAGEQREAAAAALRSTRRMRRLVADLLLLARADAGRAAPARAGRPVGRSLVEAAAELEPVAGDHELTVDAPTGASSTARATSCTASR